MEKILNTVKKLALAAFLVLFLSVHVYLVWVDKNSWNGINPTNIAHKKEWSDVNGVIISPVVWYYSKYNLMVIDVNMNFIISYDYCSGLFYSESEAYYEFEGQVVKFVDACYPANNFRVLYPQTTEGVQFLQSILLAGKSIELKRSKVRPGQLSYWEVENNPIIPAVGFKHAIFLKTPEGIEYQRKLREKKSAEQEKKYHHYDVKKKICNLEF